jgi:O-antigen/teichoic acid export membrane protein
MAYTISNIPATEITHVFSRVTFPAYSKLQDNLPRLREAYLKVLQLTFILCFPLVGLTFVLAPDITRILLGEKWIPMVPALQVLLFAGLARSISATTGPILYSLAKPRANANLQFLRLLLLAILIFPLTDRLGILGATLAVSLSIFIATLIFSYVCFKIIEAKINHIFKIFILPFISTLIVTFAIWGVKSVIRIEFIGLSLFVVLGIITYLTSFYLLRNIFGNYFITSLNDTIIEQLRVLSKQFIFKASKI